LDARDEQVAAAIDAARGALDQASRVLLDRPVRPQCDLTALAAGLLRDRQKRAEHLPADFFGEPAWDALLILFAAPGNEMRQIDLFRAIRVPHTSGLRWLCRLKGRRTGGHQAGGERTQQASGEAHRQGSQTSDEAAE